MVPSSASDAPDVHARDTVRRIGSATIAHAGGAVYGALLVGALLAAEDARHQGYGATIEASVVVVALYWLTNLYAHGLGVRRQRRERLNARLLWSSGLEELPIVEGALVPLVVLLVAWVVGVTIASAVSAAVWAAAGMIVVLEVAAGWRSRRGRGDVGIQATVGVAIGFALIGVKLILH